MTPMPNESPISCRSPKLAAFVALADAQRLLTRFARHSSPFDELRMRISRSASKNLLMLSPSKHEGALNANRRLFLVGASALVLAGCGGDLLGLGPGQAPQIYTLNPVSPPPAAGAAQVPWALAIE